MKKHLLAIVFIFSFWAIVCGCGEIEKVQSQESDKTESNKVESENVDISKEYIGVTFKNSPSDEQKTEVKEICGGDPVFGGGLGLIYKVDDVDHVIALLKEKGYAAEAWGQNRDLKRVGFLVTKQPSEEWENEIAEKIDGTLLYKNPISTKDSDEVHVEYVFSTSDSIKASEIIYQEDDIYFVYPSPVAVSNDNPFE